MSQPVSVMLVDGPAAGKYLVVQDVTREVYWACPPDPSDLLDVTTFSDTYPRYSLASQYRKAVYRARRIVSTGHYIHDPATQFVLFYCEGIS